MTGNNPADRLSLLIGLPLWLLILAALAMELGHVV